MSSRRGTRVSLSERLLVCGPFLEWPFGAGVGGTSLVKRALEEGPLVWRSRARPLPWAAFEVALWLRSRGTSGTSGAV